MKYRVISDFKDLRGDGHEYKAGDIYPHTGDADADRVQQLITPTIQRGALIEVVEEKPEKVEKPEKAEAPKPASRRKKKED